MGFLQVLGSSLLVTAFLITACGDEKKKEDTPVTVYGNLTLSESKSGADNATVKLTSVTACTHNVDTGRVDMTISQGAGSPALSIAIKDFASSPKAYVCTQAADNGTSDTDVGGKFVTCMASVSVLSSATGTTLNKYNMYRETVATKKFTYGGACSINITSASVKLTGTVSCATMVQTDLEGAARNPIDGAITANLQGDFTCDIVK